MIKAITTAGYNMVSFCFEMWQTGRRILSGDVVNEDWFVMIFEPDNPDKWDDPKEWRKANPNWGESINPDMFQKQFQDALTMPSKKLAFKQLNLNIWTHSGEDWLDLETWKKCGKDLSWADLAGRACYLGFDLAERRDVCAVYAVFKNLDGGLTVKPFFFLPSAIIDKKTKEENVPYRQWADDGNIYVVGEDTINMDDMIQTVQKVLRDHDIDVAHAEFDKHQALQVMNYLEGLGYSVDHTPQTFSHFNEPTRRLESDCIDGLLVHDNNPVMNWMTQNVKIIMQSHTEYIKPVKKDDKSKIDGVHALLNALCGMKKADDIPPDDSEPSIQYMEI